MIKNSTTRNPFLRISMLWLLLIGAFMLSPNIGYSQTVLINPAGDGGFQNGATFAANGWTVDNGTAVNKWFVGSAQPLFATPAAYVSADNGVTNGFTNTSPSVTHFYRDVTFPAGETNINLAFNWLAQGEIGFFDAIIVSVAPTSFTPTASTTSLAANTVPSPMIEVGRFWTFSTVQSANINISAGIVGNCSAPSTMRLIFTWKNDGSGGSAPAGAIDNINLVTAAPATPAILPGTFTINNTLPTGGSNFINFTDAINAINSTCVVGNFVFDVSAGQTFTENPPAITASGNPLATITFQKSGVGANPIISATGGAGATDAAIAIAGGDYFTFDGIDINISTGSALEYGYQIRNGNAANGANFNTIKNCRVSLNNANTASIGIIVTSSTTGGGLTPISAAGSNSNNNITSVIVENSYAGIFVTSGTATFPGLNNNVSGTIANPTRVGASYVGVPTGGIGGGTTATYGIQFNAQSNFTVSNAVVQNIVTTTGVIRGIYVQGSQGNINVNNNKVYGLRLTSTSSTNAAHGMEIGMSTTAGLGISANIFNNMISDVTHGYTGTATATRIVKGLLLISGSSSSVFNVSHNSISIDGTSFATGSNICFELGGTTTITNVRNNIFANFTGAQTGVAKHYAIRSTSATTVGPASSVFNNNDYYIANTTNGFVGLLNATDAANIVNWTSGLTANPGADNATLNVNPNFLNNTTNLHLNTATPTQLESGGIQLNILNDIDGNIRQGQPGYAGSGSSPDIGADEDNFILLDIVAPSITYTPLTFTCATGDRTLSATIVDASGVPLVGATVPRIYYNKNGGTWFSQAGLNTGGIATNSTWTFTIVAADMGGLIVGDVVNYYVIAQDIAGTPNVGSSPSGVVATDVNTITTHPITTSNFSVSPTLSGTYAVGLSGIYPTLTAAVNAYNTSCLGGPVVFELKDANYPTETFPISININSFASSVNTLTIRPGASVTPLITGSTTSGIIKINGADYITIDGSNNGTNTRDLTIENTNTGTSSSAVWIASTTNNGATNNTVKNVIAKGNAPTTTLGAILVSGSVAGGVAEAQNNNIVLENNSCMKSFFGIAIAGSTTQQTGNVISNNSIGSSVATEYIGSTGLFISNNNGAQITNNTIFNIISGAAANPMGILITAGNLNTVVNANTIKSLQFTGTGGYGPKGIIVVPGLANSNISITNNMISDLKGDGWSSLVGDGIVGIRVGAHLGSTITTGGVKIYNNSVNLGTGTFAGNASGTISAALYLSSTTSDLDIRNNILYTNLQNSTAAAAKTYAIYSDAPNTAFTQINNNDYSVGGTQGVLGFIGSARATLADIQTGFGSNTNSISVVPVFNSLTDLHLALATNVGLIDQAVSIPSVTTDFDGQLRGATPDVGADEFGDRPATPISLTQSVITPSCTGGSTLFVLPPAPLGVTYYLQSNATDTSTANPFVGDSVQISTNGIYYVNARNTSNLWSVGSATITVTNIPVAVLPPSPVADLTPACLTTNISVPASTDPNVTFYWQGTNPLGVSTAQNANTPLTVTASGTYYVAAFDASSNCWSNTNGVAVVIDTQIPTAPIISPAAPAVCIGNTQLLVASSQVLSNPSGTGTSSSTAVSTSATLGPNPLQNYWGGVKQQQLFTAAELNTMGLVAGSSINSLQIQMNTASTTYGLLGLRVKMKGTNVSALTPATFESGLVTVRASATYTPNAAAGWNTIAFTTPFVWNGTDNIVLEINYSNNNSPTTADNSAFYTTTSFVSTLMYRADNLTVAAMDSYVGAPTYSYSQRNNFKFDAVSPSNVTWSPVSDLYTNAGATIPYVLNALEDSVYTQTTVAVSYSATAHIGACSSTPTSVSITVNPLPTVDAGATQTACPGYVTLNGSGASTYTWSNGVINNVPFVANATNLYTVTGTDINGCVDTDTVTVFVSPATPVTITPAGPIVTCQNQPVLLTANGPAPGPVTTITQWNFNNGDLIPNVGTGTALLAGGTTGSFVSGAGSSDATQPGQAWNTSGYPTQGTNPKTAGAQFNVSTAGFSNIVMKYDVRHSGTGSNTYVVQYNPDVTNGLSPWIDVQTFVYTTSGSFINNETVDLSALPATNNNPNLGLRVVSNYAASTSTYTNISGAGYNTAGTVRYDMVTFSGNPATASYVWSTNTTPNLATGATYTPTVSGTYRVTATEAGVCPGVDSVTVTVNPIFSTTINPTICGNQTYTLFGGTQVNTSGIYPELRTSVNGCDSTVLVNLTVYPVYNTNVGNVTICSNQTYTLANGNVVSTPGVYVRTVPTINNCDSVVTVNLIIIPAQSINNPQAICAGQTFTLPNGTPVTTGGVYTNTFVAANGCDSTIITTLTIKPVFTSTQNPVICNGDLHTMPNGTTQGVAGTYVFPFTAINGCDSTITVNLTVNPVFTTNLTTDLCPGEVYTQVDGTTFNTAGVFTAVTNSINGCDSTVIVTATVRPIYNTPVAASICAGGSYTLVNGAVVTTAGLYTSGTQTIYGCDSVVQVTLTVNPVYNQTATASICQGESYTLPNGTSVSTAGSYTSNLTSSKGCDSTIVTTLTVNPLPNLNLGNDIAVSNPPVTLNAGVGFASYAWTPGGASTPTLAVTQGGTYSVVVTNQFGCSATDEITVYFTSSVVNLGENGGSISLFPNPTADRFVVNVYGYTGGGDMKFDLINSIGQVIMTDIVNNATDTFTKELDVTSLASGSYTLRVKGQNANANLRVIIAR